MTRILRFTASWCGPCKVLSENLQNAQLNLPIEVVDIDVHPDVATDFGVRSVPTLVMMQENIEVKRIVGALSSKEITEWATTN